MHAYITLLRSNRNFSLLWLAQVVSLTGDWFNMIALSALVVAYSPENSGWAVSLLLLARTVPPMLVSPFAGVLIDRFDRRQLLVWSNLLRAVIVLGFLITMQGPQFLWLIYALTVGQFILSAVFEPAQNAILPAVVGQRDLITANTLNTVTWSVLLAFGGVLGGIVSASIGLGAALLIDALTFLVAGVLASAVRYTPIAAPGGHAGGEKVTFADGLRYLRRTPEAATTLFIKFANSLGNVDTLIVIFGTKLFIIGLNGTISMGIMYSVFGIGAVVGPALLNRFNDGSVGRMRLLVGVAFGWVTAAWLVLGWGGSLVVVCIGLLMRGMGGSANWTYSTVILQKVTADSHLGRVMAWDWTMYYLATVITIIVHGAIIDSNGGNNTSGAAGLSFVTAAIGFALWVGIVRWVRRLVPTATPA